MPSNHTTTVGVGLTAAVALSLLACTGGEEAGDPTIPLPEQIHGLQLAESRSGTDAAAQLERMHELDVAPTESVIGFYGPKDMRAVLYVSRFASPEEAGAQLIAMSSGIGSGSSGYGHHQRQDVADYQVHVVFGQGQVHYYWAKNRDLIWLAIPPALARAALAEVLGVALDDVPPLFQSAADSGAAP